MTLYTRYYRSAEARTMTVLRTILLTTVLFGLLSACTRSRTVEPTPTTEAELVTVITGTLNSSAEPIVTITTPLPDVPTASETPTPELAITPSTIDYRVQDGDTISSVAIQFGVDDETVRRMNYLLDDKIFVGQILQMPYKDGITAEGAPTATPEPLRYVVVQGDSLGGIAIQYGVSTVAIMEANNMSDPNQLYVGQQLLIPGHVATSTQTNTGVSSEANGAADTTSDNEGVTHIVQPGDTLYGIAQSYGVEAAAIISTNNIANGNQLRAGQKLLIPGISALDAARARGRIHIVQSGESLTTIAVLYGVTAQEIIEFNGIANPDSIYVGQQLIIPGQ